MRFVKTDENGQQVEAPKLFKVDGKYVQATSELCLKFGFEPVEEDIQQPAEEQQEDQLFDIELEEKDGIIWLPEDLSFEQALDAVRHITTEAVNDRSNNVKPILQKSSKQKIVVEDIALVQCVFGLDEEQIAACKKAIDLLFMHNVFPREYVFVEAQDNEADAQFNYIEEKYNAKYIFKKTGPKNKGIFLKHALWTVGAKESRSSKLAFIDADTSFINSDWLHCISKSLDGFDVSQPFQEIFFADELADTEEDKYFSCTLVKSFAYALSKTKVKYPQTYKTGHGLSMTRQFFDKINGLDVLPSNGSDVWFWLKHLDCSSILKSALGLPLRASDYSGDLSKQRVSYSKNIAFHVRHGKLNARKYETRYFNKKFCNYVNETIDTAKEIPEFKDTVEAKAHQECVLRYRVSEASTQQIFYDVSKNVFKQPNGSNKLIFLTCLNTFSGNGFISSDRIVKTHKFLLDKFCRTPHEYWCITNERINGVDTIPFELDPVNEIMGCPSQVELYRNLFPGHPVFTIDFDCVPIREFQLNDIEDGTFCMANELTSLKENMPATVFNSGTTYFKGDMSFIFDQYVKLKRAGTYIWKYFLSVQNFIQYTVIRNGLDILDIQRYVDLLLLKLKNGMDIPALSAMLQQYDFIHYLGPVKPWNKTFFVENKCMKLMPSEFANIGLEDVRKVL